MLTPLERKERECFRTIFNIELHDDLSDRFRGKAAETVELARKSQNITMGARFNT